MNEFMALDRNLKLRTLTTFIATLLSSSVLPNMTIYYTHYFGAAITGLLLVAVSVLGFIAGLYGGHLSDTYGRKPIMLAGNAMLVSGFALAAVVNSPLLVSPVITFVGFLVADIGGALADPAQQAMMIDVSTPKNRQFVFALIYWVLNIGVMLGAAIGGWFFRDYLFELLIALVIGGLINIAIIALGMDETLKKLVATSGSVWSALKAYAQVLTDRRFMIFLLGYCASTIVTMQPNYYLAVHLGRDFTDATIFGIQIYGQRMLSLITIINTVMIVFMMSIFTVIGRRMTLQREYAWGMGLQSVAFAASFILHTLRPLALCAVVLTVGEMLTVPASQTLRANLMNPAQIGAYSGATSAVRPLSAVLAGALLTTSTVLGPVGMAIAMILLGAASILLTNHSSRMTATFDQPA
ncbi:MFS transporter [Lacticaseibacillus pabuli]|uniref:MFS transporter n=1 Tax=Lacticaseibacillus pabuli TaxID=3025672 RepID=A0ABY7WUA9_9LACO|nr:MFS transporter [Lacticaseibacillus sp. KACC 23028]WDF83336.1 MFS transporter [Lacticaseibacillus sp. KACC 23028]